MAETLSRINKKLESIKKATEEINFGENDVEKIKKLKGRLEKIDQLFDRDDFNAASLKQAITFFEAAKQKAEQYNPRTEIDEAIEDEIKYDEYSPRVNAKKELKQAINGKYDLLTQKQRVFKMLLENYNEEEFKERGQRKIDQLNKRREAVNKKLLELGSFKESARPQLNIVKDNLLVLKSLAEIAQLNESVIRTEDQINLLKRAAHKDTDSIAAYEERKQKLKEKLKGKIDELNTKFPDCQLDENDLTNSMKNVKDACEANLDSQRKDLKDQLEKSSDYSDEFKSFMSDKIAKCERKDLLKIFTDYESQLNAEDITLRSRKTKVEEYINGIENVQTTSGTGTPGTPGTMPSYEPTEAEINEKINSSDDIQQMMLIPDFSKKDKQAEIYHYLTQGKSGKIHPLAFIRSRFSKKAEEAWKNSYRANGIEEAKRRIREERRTRNQENGRQSGKRKERYAKQAFKDIRVANKAKLDEIERSFSTEPGKYTANYYDDEDLDR